MVNRLIISVCVAFMFFGCDGGRTYIEGGWGDGTFPKSDTFIQLFLESDTIMLRKTALENNFILTFDGDFVDNQRRADLCRYYGDVDFNQRILQYYHKCIVEESGSLSIWANVDFDDNHPAGSLLDDIITAYMVSPAEFILSGYTNTYGWNKDTLGVADKYFFKEYGYSPIMGRLSEMSPEDFKIIYPAVYLWLDEVPPAGDIEFTAVFDAGDKRLETKAVLDFGKGGNN